MFTTILNQCYLYSHIKNLDTALRNEIQTELNNRILNVNEVF